MEYWVFHFESLLVKLVDEQLLRNNAQVVALREEIAVLQNINKAHGAALKRMKGQKPELYESLNKATLKLRKRDLKRGEVKAIRCEITAANAAVRQQEKEMLQINKQVLQNCQLISRKKKHSKLLMAQWPWPYQKL